MIIKPLYYIFSLILLILVMEACGSDTTTNPNTPAGTVLYSKDSISVWLPPSTSSSGSDSTYFSTQQTGGVEVYYTLQSNIDTSFGSARWGFYTNATPAFPLLNITGPIDVTDSTNLNFSTQGATYFSFSVRLNVINSTVPYYVRVKNIKIKKL
jgi:hypothetical protein